MLALCDVDLSDVDATRRCDDVDATARVLIFSIPVFFNLQYPTSDTIVVKRQAGRLLKVNYFRVAKNS